MARLKLIHRNKTDLHIRPINEVTLTVMRRSYVYHNEMEWRVVMATVKLPRNCAGNQYCAFIEKNVNGQWAAHDHAFYWTNDQFDLIDKANQWIGEIDKIDAGVSTPSAGPPPPPTSKFERVLPALKGWMFGVGFMILLFIDDIYKWAFGVQ